MIFQNVKEYIHTMSAAYKEQGYEVEEEYAQNAYRVSIQKNNQSVEIRDGYISDTNINTRPIELTSFDVFFILDKKKYLHYVSDYPLGEYIQRLEELKPIFDSFFKGAYTVSFDRNLVFWHKEYLNIDTKSSIYHFMRVRS
jgi:hypothetical protein